MAKTISELRNQSIQVRDASAAGENTATRVGTVLNDIVGHIEDYENTQSSNNSSQDAKIEGVKSSLNAEIARAKTEESNLTTQIDTERTERQAAVSREETARIQADNDEKTARENADITLRSMIQTEVSNRQIAVKQEEIRAMAAEKANTQAIADENARATTAEAAETARAKAEEERLQGEIDNTNDNLNSLDDKVNSNNDHFSNEVARLDTTDNEIKADLAAETARAMAADEANAQAITDEVARAKAAEEAIIFDVSAYNNGAVFESISALLSNSNLNAIIPVSVRHGGMTIRFIQGSEQSSDNKYVQYRLMSDTFNTTPANWQGVDDEPTAGSDNLVKSGGVADKISELDSRIDGISNEDIETEEDSIDIEDNDGNTVFHLDENGLDAKNVRSNGKEVLTEHQDISGKQDKIPQISQDETSSDDDEQIFASDDFDEEQGTGEKFVCIGSYGVKSKAFIDMDGNNILIPKLLPIYKKNVHIELPENATIVLYGDSISSTQYPWYKEWMQKYTGIQDVRNTGNPGQTVQTLAQDQQLLLRVFQSRTLDVQDWKNNPKTADLIIIELFGNNDGAIVGTFGAVNGQPICEETSLEDDATADMLPIQAVSRMIRKIKKEYYNIVERANLTGDETEEEKYAKIDAVKKPYIAILTPTPQKRDSDKPWSEEQSWINKRNAVVECANMYGIHCIDIYSLWGVDMEIEPYYSTAYDSHIQRGIYTMDGLHPSKYGYEKMAQIICGELNINIKN